MALLKNLKSLFIVEEGTVPESAKEKKKEEKAPEKQEKQQVVKNSDPEIIADNQDEVKDNGPGKVNAKFTETLLKAIEANNLEGFDYLEFKQALQNMSKMNMDEATTYQTAYMTAQTMGVTTQKLVDSANFYLNVLKKEEDKFQSALKHQSNEKVVQRKSEIERIEKNIEAKKLQVQKLQKEIEADGSKLSGLKKQVSSVTAKIEKTKKDFRASYEGLKLQLDADIEKIQQYLKK